MMYDEEWEDVEGYEGSYQVSNLGRVKSLERTIYIGDKKRVLRNKILKLHTNSHGYLGINLHKDKKIKRFSVHQLVARTAIKNSKNRKEVNHKDGNKLNNHYTNLEWCTRSENVKHSYKTGLTPNRSGKNNPNYKGIRNA